MDTREPLTDRQREALDFIQSFNKEFGYPPSVREIAKDMGITSTNGVQDHLKALERKGYIVREPGKSRAVKIVGDESFAEPGGSQDQLTKKEAAVVLDALDAFSNGASSPQDEAILQKLRRQAGY